MSPREAGLKGRRLELRPLAEADAEVLHAAVEVSREHLRRRLRWVSRGGSLEESRAFIRRGIEEAGRGAGRVSAIIESRTGVLVGVASLGDRLATEGVAELSGWVRADRLDKGYALEAGRIVLVQAFRREGLQRLYAMIDPANRAARKVFQRLGFRYEGCLRHHRRLNNRWVDQECWGLLRTEWRP